MHPNKKSKIVLAVKTVIIACFVAGITSCDSYKEENSVAADYIILKDPGRDTTFSISNLKLNNDVTIKLEGTLSDTSLIRFSTDTLLVKKATFFVPKTKNNFSETFHLTDIKSESLFIKYHPIKSSVVGDVRFAVTFLYGKSYNV